MLEAIHHFNVNWETGQVVLKQPVSGFGIIVLLYLRIVWIQLAVFVSFLTKSHSVQSHNQDLCEQYGEAPNLYLGVSKITDINWAKCPSTQKVMHSLLF